jgi:3-oxoacyl-[acyl-carrier protein] reductase
MSLTGKVAIVTGGNSGIGKAIALALAAQHANVVIDFVVDPDATDALEQEIVGLGGQAIGVKADVSKVEDLQALIDATVKSFGRLDVMVNNAGLGGTAELVDMTDEQWLRVLDVTLNGTFRCTRAALQQMKTQGKGVIVNNSSVIGWRAQIGQAHYAAAKAGVNALTRTAGVEGARYGVRVNAVSPSIAMHAFLAKVTTDELLEELSAREAFGRPAEPWEVANVIVFLASDYSSYMTGEIVSVSSQHP